jgi:hypothetical protein
MLHESNKVTSAEDVSALKACHCDQRMNRIVISRMRQGSFDAGPKFVNVIRHVLERHRIVSIHYSKDGLTATSCITWSGKHWSLVPKYTFKHTQRLTNHGKLSMS